MRGLKLAVLVAAVLLPMPAAASAQPRGWSGFIRTVSYLAADGTSQVTAVTYTLDGRLQSVAASDPHTVTWAQPATWTVNLVFAGVFTCLTPPPESLPFSANFRFQGQASGGTGFANILIAQDAHTSGATAISGSNSDGTPTASPDTFFVDYTDSCPRLDRTGPAGTNLVPGAGGSDDASTVPATSTSLSGQQITNDVNGVVTIRTWQLTRSPDADFDGIEDGVDNCKLGYNPGQEDVNPADGIGDVCDGIDSDGDGLTDGDERRLGTDPTRPDTDGDGLTDGDEVHVHHTDPLKSDTDGDGLTDGDEVLTHHTDPLKSDTDGDGYSDGTEVTVGTDPNDPNSKPNDNRPRPPSCGPNFAGQRTVTVGQAVAFGCFAETRPGVWRTRTRARIGGIDVLVPSGSFFEVEPVKQRIRAGAGVSLGVSGESLHLSPSLLHPELAAFALANKGSVQNLLSGLVNLEVGARLSFAWTNGGTGSTITAGIDASRLPLGRAAVNVLGTKGTASLTLSNDIGFLSGSMKVDELSIGPKDSDSLATFFKLTDAGGTVEYTPQGYLWTATATATGGDQELNLTARATLRWLSGIGPVGLGMKIVQGGKAARLGLRGGAIDVNWIPDLEAIGEVDGGFKLGGSASLDVIGRLGIGKKLLTRCHDPLGGYAGEGSFEASTGAKLGASNFKLKAAAKLDICTYFTSGYSQATLTGDIDLVEGGNSLAGVTGAYTGYYFGTAQADKMELEGTTKIRLPGLPDPTGQVVISEFAFAGCGDVGWWSGGFVYYYIADQFDLFHGCDLGPYKSEALRLAPGATLQPFAARTGLSALAGVTTAALPAGLSQAAFRVRSIAGAPAVTVSGPNGRKVVVPAGLTKAVVTADSIAAASDVEQTTWVIVRNPAAGNWTVTLDPVIAEFSTVDLAQGLPAPKVAAKVTKKGSRRRVTVHVAPLPGQSVRFIDRAGGAVRVLGTVTNRPTAQFTLTPIPGARARHTIEATVYQDLAFRRRVTVAHYRAPAETTFPGRVAKLRARRSGGSLLLTWKPAPRAIRYLVIVRRGNTTLFSGIVRRPAAKVARVAAGRVTVTVRAVSGAGLIGPTAKVTKRVR